MALFCGNGAAPLIAIDYEGGFVQRLISAHVCTDRPAPRHVATSSTWNELDLPPFRKVLEAPDALAIVMTGYLRLSPVAPDRRPTTVSAPIVTWLLRTGLGYG